MDPVMKDEVLDVDTSVIAAFIMGGYMGFCQPSKTKFHCDVEQQFGLLAPKKILAVLLLGSAVIKGVDPGI